MQRRIISMLITILLAGTAFAQEKGSIRGIIKDKASGEALIGVNISVQGTYYGASTDEDGFYLIPNVTPGEYALEVAYIGYKVIQQTGVRIAAGESITLNFALEATPLALGQEVDVIGQKPLLDLQETSTVRSLSSDDIYNRIVDDAMGLVTQQVGVVEQDNQIHIRGGRSYESQYMIDGISVQDPLSGTGFGLNISANAIEEVEIITGGFKAEYGQATSGIVKVRTKTGDDKYEGYFSYKSDHAGIFKGSDFSFNTDQYEFNLSGPEPFTSNLFPGIGLKLPGKIYFFLNVYSALSDDYTGATSPELRSSISPRVNLFGDPLF
ncbi:MAG: carboxypeptidase-like regulatory domain-containing protein, partial [Calditrichaeota bacterium]|nr:carboxypeptidase-like regulatory domain-containing protein [Calditrichota bacterium]MCB0295962.1 carboxypeptidase-like regulatory domain-containing protein [Calditrichota bacterium]MCB0315107.1 carboxypeptidase-like regulatory domain-containing protein [Calditrichota bacterium]